MNPIALLRPARLILIALLALPCAALTAQETAPAPKPARPESSDIITIDFPGGPLRRELVTALHGHE